MKFKLDKNKYYKLIFTTPTSSRLEIEEIPSYEFWGTIEKLGYDISKVNKVRIGVNHIQVNVKYLQIFYIPFCQKNLDKLKKLS